MVDLVLALIGFIPLVLGADFLVNGAASLARKYNVPPMVIGLTIVAFGTSAPELTVNVLSSIEKNNSIVLGNVVGSNLFNILVILGISAVIRPLQVKSRTTWIEIPLCFLAALVLLIMANDSFIDRQAIMVITRSEGMILLLFFVIFLVYNFLVMKEGAHEEVPEIRDFSVLKSWLFIIFGLVLLLAGGRMIVFFAVNFCESLGIPQRIIALTVISIGTSLPELATSVSAAFKKNEDIALGNILGSNIFNLFLILGVSAVINPVALSRESVLDLSLHLATSLLLFVFIFTGKGRQLDRWEGIIMVLLYMIYLGFLIFIK